MEDVILNILFSQPDIPPVIRQEGEGGGSTQRQRSKKRKTKKGKLPN
jgi:hypothetical protein